jgi:formate-dependent nitrite reductase membrane component NrfD
MDKVEGQKNWGWMVVLDLFLAGLGSGAFLASFVLDLLGEYPNLARAGSLVGPVAALLGSLLLVVDLGSPGRSLRLWSSPAALRTSWMIRGAWLQAGFIILGLAYALPRFAAFEWLPWTVSGGLGRAFGWLAAVLALAVPAYPGMMLGVVQSIPAWNNAALPVLFLLSGLGAGVAVLQLLAPAMPVDVAGLHRLAIAGVIVVVLLAMALAAYIEVVRHMGTTGAASVRLLKSGVFIFGAAILGLAAPLVLLAVSLRLDGLSQTRVLGAVSAVLMLVGGLLLRHALVASGVRIPVRSG